MISYFFFLFTLAQKGEQEMFHTKMCKVFTQISKVKYL